MIMTYGHRKLSRFDRRALKRSIAIALCLAWAAGAARASSETFILKAALNIAGPTFESQSFDLPRFDPRLGTLRSVVVSTQTVADFEYEIHDDYGNPSAGEVYFTSEAGTIAPGANIESGVATPLVSISIGQDGDYYSPTYKLEDDVKYAVPSSYLSQYMGSGSNLIVQYAGPTPADYGSQGFNFIGQFIAPNGQLMMGDVTITATFTYTFTSSVPEPSSFVLASLSAVGMGLLFRRSRHFMRPKKI